MKITTRHFGALAALALCAAGAAAQDQSPAPDRTVGAAEVYHFKDKNKTRAQVRIHPSGDPKAGGRQDALSMDVIFESDGAKVARPRHVYIAFVSYSPAGPKYQKERDLVIYTEGLSTERWAGRFRTRMLSSTAGPSGGSTEVIVSPAIDYDRFLKIIAAHRVSFDLGKTHFTLTKEDIKALNDLNQTIEK